MQMIFDSHSRVYPQAGVDLSLFTLKWYIYLSLFPQFESANSAYLPELYFSPVIGLTKTKQNPEKDRNKAHRFGDFSFFQIVSFIHVTGLNWIPVFGVCSLRRPSLISRRPSEFGIMRPLRLAAGRGRFSYNSVKQWYVSRRLYANQQVDDVVPILFPIYFVNDISCFLYCFGHTCIHSSFK